MRVARRDNGHPAGRADGGLEVVVDVARRVPQQVAPGGLREQRALADPHAGGDADPLQPGLDLVDRAPVALRDQLGQGRPPLAAGRTYCRSSAQIGQIAGGRAVSGCSTAQVRQIQTVTAPIRLGSGRVAGGAGWASSA